MGGGLELDNLSVPFQPKPFCDYDTPAENIISLDRIKFHLTMIVALFSRKYFLTSSEKSESFVIRENTQFPLRPFKHSYLFHL